MPAVDPSLAAVPSPSGGALSPPSNGIDLRRLASDTSAALQALEPFFVEGSKWSLFASKNNQIASQVKTYARAIDNSIQASGHGYTIATEAIGALDYIFRKIDAKELDPEDKFLKGYLEKTSELADKGHKLAKKALDDFRDVRKNLSKVMRTVEQKQDSEDATAAALEKFKATLSEYVDWWVEMEMKHSTQKERNSVDYNAIRQKDVLDQWKDLRSNYVVYTKEIMAVQDDYDHILKAK